jgi:hypothetical protein
LFNIKLKRIRKEKICLEISKKVLEGLKTSAKPKSSSALEKVLKFM